jgi:hypothetical protein
MDLQEAEELFRRYDGSRFFMSRDGREEEYREAGVPREIEAGWLEQLKLDRLRLLSQEGNWQVLAFFLHHSDLGRLADFIQAEPRGRLWERCAYLEMLLRYASEAMRAGRDPDLVPRAVRKAILEAERLLKKARADASIGRIRDVLDQAHSLLQEIEMN